MRSLIIPDLHHHTEHADYWLSSQSYDRVIFLGDYFDNFGDNVTDARLTASWLRQRMDSTDDVLLLGNHDAAYLFPNFDALYCPGFTKAKARAIHEILTPKHWQRFKLAHVEQGWLLSHAGFHPHWTKTPIIARCGEAMKKAARGIVDPLLGAGIDREGAQPFGGATVDGLGQPRADPRHPSDRGTHTGDRSAREAGQEQQELLPGCAEWGRGWAFG